MQIKDIMQPGGLLSYSSWGISLEWTHEEQRTLETFLLRFPADRFDPVQRYVRIAAALPRKNVRDVALRARWTAIQQQLPKRTLDHTKPGMPPMAPKPIISMAPPLPGAIPPPFIPPPTAAPLTSDGPPTIDGPISHLLDANLAILNHFRTNMAAFKVHENTQLLVQFRDNILQILHAMETMGGVMAEMPQLPVRLNVDLANNFLPSRPAGVLTYDGMVMPPPPQPALNAPGMVPLNGFAPGGGTVQQHTKVVVPPPSQPAAGVVNGVVGGAAAVVVPPPTIVSNVVGTAIAQPPTTAATTTIVPSITTHNSATTTTMPIAMNGTAVTTTNGNHNTTSVNTTIADALTHVEQTTPPTEPTPITTNTTTTTTTNNPLESGGGSLPAVPAVVS